MFKVLYMLATACTPLIIMLVVQGFHIVLYYPFFPQNFVSPTYMSFVEMFARR